MFQQNSSWNSIYGERKRGDYCIRMHLSFVQYIKKHLGCILFQVFCVGWMGSTLVCDNSLSPLTTCHVVMFHFCMWAKYQMKDTKAKPQSSISLSQRIEEENIKMTMWRAIDFKLLTMAQRENFGAMKRSSNWVLVCGNQARYVYMNI